MTSQIRVDEITNRSGLGTVTIYDNGFEFTGVTTFTEDVDITGGLTIGGVLTYEDTTNIDSVGLITARAGVKVPDSQKIFLGTGDDLQIYHSGGDSYITNSDGNLNVVNSTDGWIRLQPKSGEEGVIVKYDGAVELYHDNSLKLSTAAGGVNVAGNINLNSADNYEIRLGANNDLKLYHDGSNSYVQDAGTGNLILSGTRVNLLNPAANETMVSAQADGPVELYHNNVKKLETTTSGVAIHEDTNKVVRFTGSIGEIGNVTGFQASNTAGDSLTDFGIRATTLRFATAGAERVRIHSGGTLSVPTGIELGSGLDGTSANTLDDYEEGTFSPTYTSGLTGDTYSNTGGHYTKIGNFVTFTIRIAGAGTNSGSEQVKIGNLPFTSSSSAREGGAWFNYRHDLDTGGAPFMHISQGDDDIKWYNSSGSSWVGSDGSGLNNKTYHVQGFYYSDS